MLAIVDLEVTTEGIRTGTTSERWGEKVPNFRGGNANTAGAKWCADRQSGEVIIIGESEGTSRMTSRQGRA